MMSDDKILKRDCAATVVPSGDTIVINQGTPVTITHRLGGNFTVVWAQGMARIAAKDADALGEDVLEFNRQPVAGTPTLESIWERLKGVYDPEIPVNIVDLGLVYHLEVRPGDDGFYHAEMKMTLTAPGCGMGPVIAKDAEDRLLNEPGISSAHVSIVFDPPWDQSMISEEGKMILGLI